MADKKLECKDVLGQDQVLVIDNDMNLTATTITPSKPVSTKLAGRDIPIGFADKVVQTQHIAKDDVHTLYMALVEQLEAQVDMLKPHKDFLDTHEHYDPEGKMFGALESMKGKDFKKYSQLNTYSTVIFDLETAKSMLKKLEPGLKSIAKQVEFLQAQYGF